MRRFYNELAAQILAPICAIAVLLDRKWRIKSGLIVPASAATTVRGNNLVARDVKDNRSKPPLVRDRPYRENSLFCAFASLFQPKKFPASLLQRILCKQLNLKLVFSATRPSMYQIDKSFLQISLFWRSLRMRQSAVENAFTTSSSSGFSGLRDCRYQCGDRRNCAAFARAFQGKPSI